MFVKLNTNNPQCTVITEEPLITIEYIDINSEEKIIDIYASDIKNSTQGDIFEFENNKEKTSYEEKLVVIFKNEYKCICVLKKFDYSGDLEDCDDEIYWFNFENNSFEKKYTSCMILNGKLNISELSFRQRTQNSPYYIYALRYCLKSNNIEQYQKTLDLLNADIKNIENEDLKSFLMGLYNFYIGQKENSVPKKEELH